MTIFEKMALFFKRNKQKKLPLPKKQEEDLKNKKQKFKDEIAQKATDMEKTQEICNNPQLAEEIDQYFKSFNELIMEYPKTGVIPNSYNSLVHINSVGGDVKPNEIQEQYLLRNLEKSNRYKLRYIQKSNNVPCFYHISTKVAQNPIGESMVRMYLNCRNEHVAEIANYLLQLNQKDNFYFKIDASEHLKSRMKRSEKIVIYTDDMDMDYYIKLIKHLKTIKPELFVDSDKNNPFMTQLEGIAFARQPKSNVYTNLHDDTTTVPASTNTFISKIISESYKATVIEIAMTDPKLSYLLEDKNLNNEQLFASAYCYIDANYHGQLINSMERRMKILCAKNSIDIRGIDTSKEQHHSQNKQEHLMEK